METYLDFLYKLDYKEQPPTVDQVLCEDRFLGKLTEGGRTVYPIWKDALNEVMIEDSKYLVALTGAIGTGKTRTAIRGLIIMLSRVLCLKRPWDYFNLEAGGKMAIVFFNLNKLMSKGKGFNLFQSYISSSSWFRKRGILHGSPPNEWLEFPIIEYKIGSPYVKGFGALGEDVIGGIMDEVDSPGASEKDRVRVLKAYKSSILRHETRFVQDGESLGKFFLVASKQEELSFLNTFISEMKDSPKVKVYDVPIWDAKPQSNYSGKKTQVMLGDVYTPSKVLSTKEERQEAINQGFKVLSVPNEYEEDFIRDMEGALRDLAGISVVGLRKSKLFGSEKLLVDCYDSTKKDPVKRITIRIGLEDEVDLINYLDLSAIRIGKNYPRFLHCDIAFSGEGDALGLAMSCVRGWSEANVELEDGTIEVRRVPVVETDFVMRIKGKPGDEIPLASVRRLVLDLRLRGFNIVRFTSDHKAMSIASEQILKRAGINSGYLSVDRTPEPYLIFRNLVNEKKWICHRNAYLHFELSNLEYDRKKGKIDHPEKVVNIMFLEDGNVEEVVLKGSKDMADSVVGSVAGALESEEIPLDTEGMAGLLKKASSPRISLSSQHDKHHLLNIDSTEGRKREEENKSGKMSGRESSVLKEIFRKVNR